MALTASTMLPLGTTASDFKLLDVVSDKTLSLSELKSNVATVIIFMCNHCPFVKHIHEKLLEVIDTYQAKGIAFVAISANDAVQYPEDSPTEMKKQALDYGYTFPYLFDETQSTAKAYHAACTPDFFIFDKELRCIYRGRFDESTPGNAIPVTGNDLIDALDVILQGEKPDPNAQHPSMGCNVKWKNIN